MKQKHKIYISENISIKTIRKISEELQIPEHKIRKYTHKEKQKKKIQENKGVLNKVYIHSFILVCALTLISYSSYMAYRHSDLVKTAVTLCEKIVLYTRNQSALNDNAYLANKINSTQQKALQCYKSANIMRAQGNKQGAISRYKDAVRYNPKYTKAYINLGVTLYEVGDKDSAKKAFEKVIELHPHSSDGYNNLGNLMTAEGIYSDALKLYREALRYNPHDSIVYYNIGYIYTKQGKRNEAKEYFNYAIEINPQLLLAHVQLAHLYYQDKEFDKARDHGKLALSLGGAKDKNLSKVLKKYINK
ncbi:MAG: tetratricopeptide repeat protein [Candidatus Ancaeobacter aquaticus]|nr:tetratricopeptide repeat protein [Candidatus Ancaeobacter aquaticus]